MLDEHLMHPTSPEDEIRNWWHEKRFSYNLIVGSFGIFVLITETVVLQLSFFWWFIWLPIIMLFGLLANLCYYIGQILELHIYEFYKDWHNEELGQKIFWMGIFFSISTILWIEYIALTEGTPTPF